jgi:transcriptional regulator with XRE-family HTH domain
VQKKEIEKMADYGKRIAEFRKSKNLTQAELGQKLNVTSQAVSKWENGLSEPDFDTTKKMCELFGVSIDELLGDEPVQKTTQNEQDKEQSNKTTVTPQPKVIIGYCDKCKKPIEQGSRYSIDRENGVQKIYCASCKAKIDVHKAKVNLADNNVDYDKGMKVGCIWSIIITVILLISAISSAKHFTLLGSIPIALVVGYCAFALISQMYWGEAVPEVFDFFIRTFRFPGLIFTLDLDGIIWFICVKLLFAVLGFLLSGIVFIFGVFFSGIFAGIALPFAIAKHKREEQELVQALKIKENVAKNVR